VADVRIVEKELNCHVYTKFLYHTGMVVMRGRLVAIPSSEH
jgi:hypothetical protein